MKIKLDSAAQAMSVVKRMVFLAYNASRGYRTIQIARLGGKFTGEEQVWKCAYDKEDYPLRVGVEENEVHCDYVFGRMMKWGCKWEGNIVTINDREFSPDHQSFCFVYPNNKALAAAALVSLGINSAALQE